MSKTDQKPEQQVFPMPAPLTPEQKKSKEQLERDISFTQVHIQLLELKGMKLVESLEGSTAEKLVYAKKTFEAAKNGALITHLYKINDDKASKLLIEQLISMHDYKIVTNTIQTYIQILVSGLEAQLMKEAEKNEAPKSDKVA